MNKEHILSHLDFKSFYKSHVINLKENGKAEAIGLCPFHNDHRPSLSVNLTNGLYNCFACPAKGDVFKFYQDYKKVDFKTALKEIAEMQGIAEPAQGKVVATFEYKDLEGKILYIKERIEPARNGRSKEFIFKHFKDGKWVIGRGSDPVLYNLPQLSKSKYIFITEGEAKADLLMKWGLTATCLNSGANSPFSDDYLKYFEGKEKVIILPDNDSPGRAYADKIASALHGKVGKIKVVALPELKETEDIVDWTKTKGNDKTKLFDIIRVTPKWQPSKEVEVIEDDKEPEPDTPIIDLNYSALPSFLKNLVDLISPTTLAPDEFTVTALLSAMSSVIGTRAYIQLGRRIYYPTVWAMVIAPSSDSFKSTAIREARSFILKIDKDYETAYAEKFEGYKQDFKKYELLSKENRLRTTEPIPPIRKEIDFSDDETLESFYQTLHDNPDGGLLAFDEIGGWIEGFDRYRNGSGEKRRWLTIFDNHPVKYKRKTDKTHLVIDKPFVSIIGGITQNTFNTLFKGGISDIENGFLPRFIFCKTPKITKKDESLFKPDIDPVKWDRAYQVFKKVMELRPGAVAPSPEGIEMLNDWYKQHQDQKKDPFYPDELSPFWRRLEGYLLKFALTFHQFKKATGEETGNFISVQTLYETMALTEYYKGQAWSVVRELCQGKDGRVFDELIALLKKLGGEATTKQIQQAKAYWRGRGEYLKEVLTKMQEDGLITLEVNQGRGRQSIKAKMNT